MHRQTAGLLADLRQRDHGARAFQASDQPQPFQQLQRGVDGVRARRLEPFERPRIAAPRDDVEHRRRQIDAVDVGLAVGPQAIARVPETPDGSVRDASRAAGALVGGVGGDAFGLERVDAALGVVARDLLQSGVDDARHAGNRQRCLGDVRRDDHAAASGRPERRVLRVGVERPVQRQHVHRRINADANLADRAIDLPRARQKAQNAAA